MHTRIKLMEAKYWCGVWRMRLLTSPRSLHKSAEPGPGWAEQVIRIHLLMTTDNLPGQASLPVCANYLMSGQVTGDHWSAEQECVLATATGRGQHSLPIMPWRYDLPLISASWAAAARQCSAFSCCIQDSFYLAWYLLFVNASTLFFVRGDDFQNPGQVRPSQQPDHCDPAPPLQMMELSCCRHVADVWVVKQVVYTWKWERS